MTERLRDERLKDNNHRVTLEMDGYSPSVKQLIHPPVCEGATSCSFCGRDLADDETKPCYDCKGSKPGDCWVEGWVDNLTTDEWLSGTVELEFAPTWTGHHDADGFTGLIVSPPGPSGWESGKYWFYVAMTSALLAAVSFAIGALR